MLMTFALHCLISLIFGVFWLKKALFNDRLQKAASSKGNIYPELLESLLLESQKVLNS